MRILVFQHVAVEHPGPVALANLRETELRAAASVLGVRDVSLRLHPGSVL